MNSICAECGSQVLDLALHMKIHNDTRIFVCKVGEKVSIGKKDSLTTNKPISNGAVQDVKLCTHTIQEKFMKRLLNLQLVF